MALGGVLDEFGKVNLGDDGGDVKLLRPTFVKDNVGDVKEVGKVNVGLVGGGVDAWGKGDVLEAPRIPPFPCDATGANPVKGFGGRRGEEVGKVVLVEFGGGVGHHADAPGEEAASMCLDEVGMAFQNKGIAAARGVNGFGGRGHEGGKVASFGRFLQVEARVVHEFGLGEADGGSGIEEGDGEVDELLGFDRINGG